MYMYGVYFVHMTYFTEYRETYRHEYRTAEVFVSSSSDSDSEGDTFYDALGKLVWTYSVLNPSDCLCIVNLITVLSLMPK